MSNELSFWEALSVRMRNLRDSQGWTQDEVAERIDISKTAYRSYELNLRRISVDVLMRLAALYGISMDEMLGNSARPNASTNIIHGDFTEEQILKIQKFANFVRDNQL